MTTQTAQAETLAKPHFGQFTVERKMKFSPARVFKAFEDPKAKYRWFISGEGWEVREYKQDFRTGAYEGGHFRPAGFPGWLGNDTWYLEIMKNQRIVLAYTMTMDGKPKSHSLLTFDFLPDGAGCRLSMTEQGVYFGGPDDVGNRKLGSEGLMEKLEQEIASH